MLITFYFQPVNYVQKISAVFLRSCHLSRQYIPVDRLTNKHLLGK